jgi:hypothetical protein
MLRIVVAAAAFLTMNAACAAGPIESFFHYDEPKPPVAGDCDAIAEAIGRDATWYGEFGGNRIDSFSHSRGPFSARGCFPSEYACQVWQQQALNYLYEGTMLYARCRPLSGS